MTTNITYTTLNRRTDGTLPFMVENYTLSISIEHEQDIIGSMRVDVIMGGTTRTIQLASPYETLSALVAKLAKWQAPLTGVSGSKGKPIMWNWDDADIFRQAQLQNGAYLSFWEWLKQAKRIEALITATFAQLEGRA